MLNITINVTKNFISVTVRGDLDYIAAQRDFEYIIAFCRMNKFSRILADFSGVTGVVLATHKILLAFAVKNAFELHFNAEFNPLKIAIIGRDRYLKRNLYYAPVVDILQSAGIEAMLTHEYDRAVDWITC